jgi:glycerate dehydrogenase
LVRALDEGLIAGAGFDCLTAEPPSRDHPFSRIMGRPNVIITPHIGWASQEAQQECWRQVIDNIESFEGGHSSNAVA